MTWLVFFERLLAHRWRLGLGLLALCVLAGLGAARVPMDPSIERMHPMGDSAKADFDRYRRAFPGEDSQVFVIAEGPGVFTPAGLAWKLNRLRCMTPAEIGHRVVKAAAMRAERWGFVRCVVPAPDLAVRPKPWIHADARIDPAPYAAAAT